MSKRRQLDPLVELACQEVAIPRRAPRVDDMPLSCDCVAETPDRSQPSGRAGSRHLAAVLPRESFLQPTSDIPPSERPGGLGDVPLGTAGVTRVVGGSMRPDQVVAPTLRLQASGQSPPVPFWSPIYDANPDEVDAALTGTVDFDDLRATEARADVTSLGTSFPTHCHVQGMALGDGVAITSCMTQFSFFGTDDLDGFLQLYPFTPNVPTLNGQAVHLHADPHQHAVVGQGVLEQTFVDFSGTPYPRRIGMLVPVINGRWGAATPFALCNEEAMLELRDKYGGLVYRFCHEPHPDDHDGHDLACAALVVWMSRLYLLAIRDEWLYVYRIHWRGASLAEDTFAQVGAEPSGLQIEHEKVLELNLHDATQVETVNADGSHSDWPSYANVNLFLTRDGRVYLLGGHHQFLDTWHVGLLNRPSEVRPRLTQLGNLVRGDVPSNLVPSVPQNLFFEGVAIAQYTPSRVGFWCLPRDYEWCEGPTLCSRIFYFERSW